MSKRKVGEETPPSSVTADEESTTPLLFSPGLTERQQIALAMKLSGESSHTDSFSTPRPSKINKTNKHGESPLQIAAIKGDLKQVKLLIKQGAEVNTKDHAGWSPLHEAACKGYLEVCRALLKKGAQVNVHGYCDETPLHDATFNNHTKVVELLLENGANPLLKNKSGKMPHEIGDNPHMKSMLLNAVKKFSDSSKRPTIAQQTSATKGSEVSDDDTIIGSDTRLRDVVVEYGDGEEAELGGEMTRKQPLLGGKQPLLGGKQPLLGGKQPLLGGKQPLLGGKQPLLGGGNISEETSSKVAEDMKSEETPGDVKEEVKSIIGGLPIAPKQLFKSPAKEKISQEIILVEKATLTLADNIRPTSDPAIETEEGKCSEVKEESVVPIAEEIIKEEEADKDEVPEMKQTEYYKYSYLLPEPACNTSITQNGPFTLYIARNKRPVKRAPMLECRSPPTTRSRAGGKPVDNTEAEELKTLNEGRYLLKSAVVTPRKKWLHQHATKKRHMGDIYELQRRGTPAEPPMPAWISDSMLHTKKYLLQGSVCSKLEEATEPHQYIDHIPPVMQQELSKLKQDNAVLSCKHTADKERLLLQHEQSMLRVRRQALMKHPTPSACSIMLQQQSCEYAKKLQTVSYDVNKEQLLLTMGEKVMTKFSELSEVMFKRHEQEADTMYATQRFTWVNNIHKHGLYDMPILGNVDLWVDRVEVTRLKPLVEYYDEHDPSDSDDSNR